MNKIKIYTDGSATPNPGAGGWGAILMTDKHFKEISGSFRISSNNRCELYAVIQALKCVKIKPDLEIEIYSDSKYVIDSVNKNWVFNWEKNKFRNRINSDLWAEFLALYRQFNIKMIWVKGHSDNEYNNRCDELATNASSLKNKSNWGIDENYEKLHKNENI